MNTLFTCTLNQPDFYAPGYNHIVLTPVVQPPHAPQSSISLQTNDPAQIAAFVVGQVYNVAFTPAP